VPCTRRIALPKSVPSSYSLMPSRKPGRLRSYRRSPTASRVAIKITAVSAGGRGQPRGRRSATAENRVPDAVTRGPFTNAPSVPLSYATRAQAWPRPAWLAAGAPVIGLSGPVPNGRPAGPPRNPADEPGGLLRTAAVPADGAVARRDARHRADAGVPGLVQGSQAGHFDRRAPAAVPLDRDEPLVAGAVVVGVVPAGRAVARRRARHRGHAGVPGLVQRSQAGHLDRPALRAGPSAPPPTSCGREPGPPRPRGRRAACYQAMSSGTFDCRR
jgi:hypothetical protein